MHPHYTLLALLLVLSSLAQAQVRTKVGPRLQHHLHTIPPTEMMHLYLEGEAAGLMAAVEEHGGKVMYAIPHWVRARVPAGNILALANDPRVRSVDCPLDPVVPLNDSAAYKARVHLIHAGQSPLPNAYTGKNVILGIIDTGLDFHHPDFLDSLGHTRVLAFWDQHMPFNAAHTPQPYGYGQAFDSTALNAALANNTWPVSNDLSGGGHGTGVAGAAASNGRATGRYTGVAPDCDIIAVAHWSGEQSVVDGIQYIFDRAAALGRPAVVNLSLGAWWGSHDGLDPTSLMIEDMLDTPGRMVVCAAGNDNGGSYKRHLRTQVDQDTSFTWFKANLNGVFFELWGDTADLHNVQFAIGADRIAGGFRYRGRTAFRTIADMLNTTVTDTLWSFSGNRLGVVDLFAQSRGGQYKVTVEMAEPDSGTAYNYRLMSTGSGIFDVWSWAAQGRAEMASSVPTASAYPLMEQYVMPDNEYLMAAPWACSPRVLTVANSINENAHIDCSGTPRPIANMPEWDLALTSSHGPTRIGLLKPDLAAPGANHLSAAPLQLLAQWALDTNNIKNLSEDCMHARIGGTSIASPVVAGAVALYLEKCPNAGWQEIVQAFTSTAGTDGFTDAVPNTRWGHGRLDAFAALNTSNFSAPITGPLVTCGADSVQLQGPPGMMAYAWSNGATLPTTFAAPGTIALTTTNTSGCASLPDTAIVIDTPLATIPVISLNGMELSSTSASTYQWSLNGADIAGATDQWLVATAYGTYTVSITDANGCLAVSAPIDVLVTGVGGTALSPLPSLYPVMADDHVTVRIPDAGPYSVWLMDATGARIAIIPLNATETVVPVEHLGVGSYYLQLTSSAGRTCLRFMVAH